MRDDSPCKLDAVHWQRLRGRAPEDVMVRSQCDYCESSGYYEVSFLGSMVRREGHEHTSVAAADSEIFGGA